MEILLHLPFFAESDAATKTIIGAAAVGSIGATIWGRIGYTTATLLHLS